MANYNLKKSVHGAEKRDICIEEELQNPDASNIKRTRKN